MAIYDCFQFFNEEHILDLRLNILNEFVNFFVIVESTTDHQGNPKKGKKKKKKKYVKFPKSLKQQRKTISEQSQDELEPIISTPFNSPMSDE